MFVTQDVASTCSHARQLGARAAGAHFLCLLSPIESLIYAQGHKNLFAPLKTSPSQSGKCTWVFS